MSGSPATDRRHRLPGDQEEASRRDRQERGDRGVGRGEVDDGDRNAAHGWAQDRSGLAEAARERHAAERLFARDDLRLERGECRSLEPARDAGDEDHGQDQLEAEDAGGFQTGQRQGAQRDERARHEDDRAPVAPVGDMATEQHERERRDRLDQAEPAQRQRIVGDLVGLERDDRRERADRERVRQARADERPELALLEQWSLDGHGVPRCCRVVSTSVAEPEQRRRPAASRRRAAVVRPCGRAASSVASRDPAGPRSSGPGWRRRGRQAHRPGAGRWPRRG